ncbi:hypothetical protein NDU88_005958 [Pleurodeles waltl]|uniref:Uncharacterized protein n=1 Tax=Pleurodeles waltl TaxID=8319 RepID=A0AAV7UK64_PLEWA|nr:hypothetical protein NDU88_005958 [Pleurodeles waltl]
MEKSPRGTSESIALVRQNVERKQEEDAQRVRKEGGSKEDMDGQSGGDNYRIPEDGTDDCTEAAEIPKTARKDREGTLDSRATTESKKEGSG